MKETTVPRQARSPLLTMLFSDYVDSSVVRRHAVLGADTEQRDRRCPAMPNEIADALRNTFKAVKSLSLDLRPEGDPVVQGDMATVSCTRTLHQQVGSKQFTNADRVRVVLHRNNDAWLIQSINVVH